MVVLGKRRDKKWPRVDIWTSGSRGDIKRLSVKDLERLMAKAAEGPGSAVGRPQWFRRERANILRMLLVVFGPEEHAAYRCIVAAVLKDDSSCSFTLDVSHDDFGKLPDVNSKELVSLAHLFLTTFPPLDLDSDQEESWRRLEKP